MTRWCSTTRCSAYVSLDLVPIFSFCDSGFGPRCLVVAVPRQWCLPTRRFSNLTGSFGGGYISLGAGNDNITFSGATVNGTTLAGAGDSDTIHPRWNCWIRDHCRLRICYRFCIQNQLRAGADYASFNAAVSAASIYGAAGDDTKFANVNVNGSTLFGGAGADLLNGGITIGSSGQLLGWCWC